MTLKVKLKLHDGKVCEHVVSNVAREGDRMKLFLASNGECIIYDWNTVQKYECIKLNQQTLERLDESGGGR